MDDIVNFMDDDDDDDLEVLEFIELGLPRQVYQRNDYFDMLDDVAFRKRFRLSRASVLHVLTLIENRLEYPLDINNSVSPMNQLLICLRLFSTGGHLQAVADFSGTHLSTVSRIIVRVAEAIAERYNQFIMIPNTQESIMQTQQDFFDIAAFPRIIGAIDCTHIKIQSPGGDDAEIYRNRKSYFSINTQMICDSHLKVLNVVARWPGSSHDSIIFLHSRVCLEFEQNLHPNCLLLGDSGYPNKTYLLTPLLNPQIQPEQLYNESHIRTRNCIERCFGVLKRRFPILAYGCRLKVDTLLTIIVTTSILHNIALSLGEFEPPQIPEDLDEHILNRLIVDGQIPNVLNDEDGPVAAGVVTRAQFINTYFSQM